MNKILEDLPELPDGYAWGYKTHSDVFYIQIVKTQIKKNLFGLKKRACGDSKRSWVCGTA